MRNFIEKRISSKGKTDASTLIEDFNDIDQVGLFIKENTDGASFKKYRGSLILAEQFIRDKAQLIEQRNTEGFTRDCHGDLHSGNIFLLEEPVLFDCIEFNDHFRQIDLLNELAFFAMDLEFYDRTDLSDQFIRSYRSNFEVIRNDLEAQLFLYYKFYRANVKLKVNAIKTMQAENDEIQQDRLQLFKKYFLLYVHYYEQLLHYLNEQDLETSA